MIKKTIYIGLFVVLGILIQFSIHMFIELWWLRELLSNFRENNLGLTWREWFRLHEIFSIALFLCGSFLGYWQGGVWWKRLYHTDGSLRIEKRWWRI